MSRTDHITLPMPSILRLFAIPLIEAPRGSFLMLPGTKSCLSKVTLWLAPESQITLKLSFGSMAALQATGCLKNNSFQKEAVAHAIGFLGDPFGDAVGARVGV